MKKNKKSPGAEPPVKLLDLKFTGPETVAAGIPAVLAALADVAEAHIPFRGMKALLKMNQKGGFDCSSCAWPDPDDERSPLGEYCENGAKALAEEATSKRVTAKFFAENSVESLTRLTDFEIGKKGRLTEPMYLAEGAKHYRPISWGDAFKKIAGHLNALESPDEALFYTSGRTSNEASFLYQLFAKEFGTNNMPDCSNMCHETSGVALIPTIGIGKGTVKLDDFYKAELIVVIGHNPGTNAPRMMSALEKAKEAGAKVIAINPMPEAGLMAFKNPQRVDKLLFGGTHFVDLYLPVKINTDMALLKAFELLILQEEAANPGQVLDQEFISEKTVGFENFERQFSDMNLDELSELCGVHRADIEIAGNMLAQSSKTIFCWGMGLTQQPNGVEMLREIVNICLMKGSIGKPGAGLCPVRGHSNVQGNRTMLINEKPTEEQLDRIQKAFGFDPPRKHGFDVVNAIKAMHDGRAKVFFAMGGNFLSAAPDTHYTGIGLSKLNLTVHVSTKLNRSHLIHGKEALILPTFSRSDADLIDGVPQFISTENSMGIIQSSKGILKPISDKFMNEMQIVCNMAIATLGDASVIDWKKYMTSYDAVRDAIESAIPGFENYNERVRQPGGFYLPNAPREGNFHSAAHAQRAAFTVTPIYHTILKEDEYMMATTRTHDQFNTTIYGLDDRYRGIHNERRVVFMNEDDMNEAGLKAGDKVDLFNYDDDTERVARLFVVTPYPIPKKNTATYFPETNVLVSINNTVGESNMPASKKVVIKIRPHVPESMAEIV